MFLTSFTHSPTRRLLNHVVLRTRIQIKKIVSFDRTCYFLKHFQDAVF